MRLLYALVLTLALAGPVEVTYGQRPCCCPPSCCRCGHGCGHGHCGRHHGSHCAAPPHGMMMPSIPATFLAGQPLMATQSLAAFGVPQQNVALVPGRAVAPPTEAQAFEQLLDKMIERLDQRQAAPASPQPHAAPAPAAPALQEQIEALSRTLQGVTHELRALQEDVHRLQCQQRACPNGF